MVTHPPSLYTGFVGIKDYRAKEDEFLPRATLEEKYAVHM
jgi:hypothetical protein